MISPLSSSSFNEFIIAAKVEESVLYLLEVVNGPLEAILHVNHGLPVQLPLRRGDIRPALLGVIFGGR